LHSTLLSRLQSATEEVVIPIIGAEEQCRGWLAQIGRERDIHGQIAPYERLRTCFEFFRTWEILPLNIAAADKFNDLRRQKIRIGTQDLKIAAIALANDAILLSANLCDFQKIPGLRIENWLA
jgi:tRNA(fMet)-specific endonuclease VapC